MSSLFILSEKDITLALVKKKVVIDCLVKIMLIINHPLRPFLSTRMKLMAKANETFAWLVFLTLYISLKSRFSS